MRITKRQLRRLIKEACGDVDVQEVSIDLPPVEAIDAHPAVVVENETPETNMLIEMEIASRALEQVVESVQNAAHLCHNCGTGVIEQAPVVEALATQVEALQEMLEAQVSVIQENAEVATMAEIPMLGLDEMPMLGLIGDLAQ
jgi:hypothetical protein